MRIQIANLLNHKAMGIYVSNRHQSKIRDQF
jgi:hypothetical protein